MKLKLIKGKYLKWILGIWILSLGVFLGPILYFKALENDFLGWFGEIPSFEILENPRNHLASELYTADNKLMGKYYRENRTPVRYEELSPYLVNALIATEDIRFEEHSGVDAWAIMRAILLAGSEGGGSTITQQVAKNLYRTRGKESEGLLHEYSLFRMFVIKTKEWLTSVKIEQRYTKQEIIEMYFNTVAFGHNAYGVHTAAKAFFDKHPSQLSVPEAAILVGLLKAPTRYSPIFNPDRSKVRRNTVINQMAKYGFINKAQANFYKKEPIELNYGVVQSVGGIAPYFRVETQKFLERWAEENGRDLYRDGLRIYTTIDSKMQKYAEESVNEHLIKFQKIFYNHWQNRNPWVDAWNKELPDFIENEARKSARYKGLWESIVGKKPWGQVPKVERLKAHRRILAEMRKPQKMRVYYMEGKEVGERDTTMTPLDSIRYYKHFLQAGFMVMEPQTGQVKAWVGGNNFKHFQYDHVFQAKRQPGSTFKPILYSTALDFGYTPCYKLQDTRVCFPGPWCPRNANLAYSGAWMSLRTGLSTSTNSIAAGLMKQIGPVPVIEMARELGIKSPLDTTATICLGTSDVSIFELLGAYCTFANQGNHIEPLFISRIEDREGNLIYEFIPKVRKAMDEDVAYQMLHMMQGTTMSGGTAVAIHGYGKGKNNVGWHNEVAAKTGTTQNNSDAWFMGMTPNLAAGVWVGGDTRATRFRTIVYGQGAVLALPVWGKFFEKVYADPELSKKYPKGAFARPDGFDIELDCAKMEIDRKKSLLEDNEAEELGIDIPAEEL